MFAVEIKWVGDLVIRLFRCSNLVDNHIPLFSTRFCTVANLVYLNLSFWELGKSQDAICLFWRQPRLQPLRVSQRTELPRRMIRMQNGMEVDDCDSASQEAEQNADSGEDCKMELSNCKPLSKSTLSKVTSQRLEDLPTGYRPVLVKWKDLDKCNVCHMDEYVSSPKRTYC